MRLHEDTKKNRRQNENDQWISRVPRINHLKESCNDFMPIVTTFSINCIVLENPGFNEQ